MSWCLANNNDNMAARCCFVFIITIIINDLTNPYFSSVAATYLVYDFLTVVIYIAAAAANDDQAGYLFSFVPTSFLSIAVCFVGWVNTKATTPVCVARMP